MSTWTNSDRDRIKNYLNFTYAQLDAITSSLTSFETQYGASAIVELQSKLTELDTLTATANNVRQSSNYGVTSQAVSGWYSVSRSQGSEIQGYLDRIAYLKQWLINELRLQDYAAVNTSRVIRG